MGKGIKGGYGLITLIILCSLPFAFFIGWYIDDFIAKKKKKKMEEIKKVAEEKKRLEAEVECLKRKYEMTNLETWALTLHEDGDALLTLSDEWVEDIFSEPIGLPGRIGRRFCRETWLYFRPFKAVDGCYYFLGVGESGNQYGDTYIVSINWFLRPKGTTPIWPERHAASYPKYMIENTNDVYVLKPEFRNYTTDFKNLKK